MKNEDWQALDKMIKRVVEAARARDLSCLAYELSVAEGFIYAADRGEGG